VRYVVDVDHGPDPTVVVGGPEDLLADGVTVRSMSWVDAPADGEVLVQVSAHGEPVPARLTVDDPTCAEVRWDLRRARVAPGQSVVVYDLDDRCVLGGGIAQAG
jgi:tRNA U34 2-thiouridine synthase MnmA/TrmU